MTEALEEEQISKIIRLVADYIGSAEEDQAYRDWRWSWYKDSEEGRQNMLDEYRNQPEWVDDLREYLRQELTL
jgi:hypothetical protein